MRTLVTPCLVIFTNASGQGRTMAERWQNPFGKGEDRVRLPGGPLKQKGHNYNRVWPLSFSTFGVVQSVDEEGNTSCMASRERKRPGRWALPLQGTCITPVAYAPRLALCYPALNLAPTFHPPNPDFHLISTFQLFFPPQPDISSQAAEQTIRVPGG